MALKQPFKVDTTSWHSINIDTTLFQGWVPAGFEFAISNVVGLQKRLDWSQSILHIVAYLILNHKGSLHQSILNIKVAYLNLFYTLR